MTEIMDGALEGRIKALFIMGENPMLTDPNLGHVGEALAALPFLAVQDLFLSETTEFADVVLPAAGFTERAGTFTNTERRVQLVRPALAPVPNSRPDWLILCQLAHCMGAGWAYDSPQPTDEQYPLVLSTGRVLFHWHGGTLSRRSPGLDGLAPEAELEIHPDDARRLGIVQGAPVAKIPEYKVSAVSVVPIHEPAD